MGYIFGWATRRSEPSSTDFAAILGIILGGTALNVINQIDCPEKLPLYLIGIAVGYVLYLVVLKSAFEAVRHHVERHGLQRMPLFPWTLSRPCCERCHRCEP